MLTLTASVLGGVLFLSIALVVAGAVRVEVRLREDSLKERMRKHALLQQHVKEVLGGR